ncbi:MAG: sulfatase-modifying factor enzyme 1 family protein [Paenibacillus sp.]|nr:sulfatase-modifying factor enzyme 1 family protein [Paenibacillus sp.]
MSNVLQSLDYFAISQKSSNSYDGDQNPVVNISWNDAISFCNLLSQKVGLKECYSISNDGENIICDWESDGYRLPSEAEWQYACKAGTTGYRYGELDKIAWYNENSAGTIHEVGRKEPNAWVLFMVSFTTMISTIFNSQGIIALISIVFLLGCRIVLGLSSFTDLMNPASMSKQAMEVLITGAVNPSVIWSVLVVLIWIVLTIVVTVFWISGKRFNNE